ncbi:hypothetical protein PR202_ga16891 [Eleusine coracana subsp. coracana]|uniref:WAT1-related protein n=1 Tax=Eleusine coracana subsp. coracana TaxID=191504 RepID=A0AAV5CMQ0_ELECO|nr:hypothetical protein PR202_ga16891 [Eleusine coracana subsp. coracana]
MDATSKKASIVAIAVQLILTGMSVVSKAAFNQGMSTFVFVFYRQAAGSVLLLPLAMLLHRNTLSLSMYNLSLKFTTATVASAANNSMPVLTFCLALILRMEVVKLRSDSGIAKVVGAGLCLAGVLTIAFYTGPALSPVSHHRAFPNHTAPGSRGGHPNHLAKAIWIEGTFLMILANLSWAVSIVWQAALLKDCPNKMLVATGLGVFSAVQSFVVAAAAERDFSRWRLRPDVGLLAVGYSGIVVTGVSYYLQACIVGGILMVGGLYSVLWGKSKESKTVPSNELNVFGCEQDEQGHNKTDSSYELKEATSASAGEQLV